MGERRKERRKEVGEGSKGGRGRWNKEERMQ